MPTDDKFRSTPERIVEEDQYAKAIGNLVLAAASLELFAVTLVWALLSPDDRRIGKAVTAKMSLSQLADFISRRASSLDDHLAQELHHITTGIRSVNTKRNQLIHSSWTWAELDHEGNPVRGRLSFRKLSNPTDTEPEPSTAPISEIDSVTQEIKGLLMPIVDGTARLKPSWIFNR